MLTVMTWKWGAKYSALDVARLAGACRRNLDQPYRFICVTDDLTDIAPGVEPWAIRDIGLTSFKGCFARLRMFDPEWLATLDVDRVLCLDLDLVITGKLDHVVDRDEPFVILQGANAANPCPFNGSVMLLRRGAHPEVWEDFSLEAAQAVPFYEFPDDQGWLHHKVPDAAGWNVGRETGIYAFQKPGWPGGVDLPSDAKIVAFPGWRSPEKFAHLPWVREHWRS